MKKIFTTIVMAMVAVATWAYDVKVDGIYYNLNSTENTAEVVQGDSKYAGSVSIPETIVSSDVTYSVTSIGVNAFNGCTGLTSVDIPNSVTSIGRAAFYCCANLISVTIPNSVTSIGESVFGGCTDLTSVTIPNSVKSIGNGSFSACSSLTSVTIPNSVTSINSGAFSDCTGLTSVTIPNSVTSIGQSAFEGCSGLTSVTIPNSVTSMGSYAFSHCTGLTSVTIPNSVTSMGSCAFYNCTGLTSVTIDNSVTEIGNKAFYDCSGITTLQIPATVTSIGELAFYGAQLRSIVCKQTDPSGYASAFSAVTYTHAQLYVPEGTFWDYVYVSKWGEFINIKEMASNSLSKSMPYMIADQTGCNYTVYDSETKALKNVDYTFALEEDALGSYWQIQEAGSNAKSVTGINSGGTTLYLYNRAAGQYADIDVDGNIILSSVPVGLDIQTSEDGITINGHAKMFVLCQNEDILTGIDTVKGNDPVSTDKAEIYSISGQRLNAPQKGVNIIGGKKVLVK